MILVELGASDAAWGECESYLAVENRPSRHAIGLGLGRQELLWALMELQRDYRLPASRQTESLGEKFHRLAEEWRTSTAHLSSVTEMATHPAYQEIIGLGKPAIPLLVKALERNLDHWFWALRAITGIDPVPPNDRGNMRKMADAWVGWARQQGSDLR